MVVNRGFSFSNIVGMYALKTKKSNYQNRLEDYIITAVYPGNLKQLYSQNSYEEGSIAYEFSSIDTTNMEQVISFCNKYGLLYSNRLIANKTNNYIFMKTYKSIFSEAVPDFSPDELPLDTFVEEVRSFRCLWLPKAECCGAPQYKYRLQTGRSVLCPDSGQSGIQYPPRRLRVPQSRHF